MVPVGEEDAAAEEDVGGAASEALDAADEVGGDPSAAELVHQLVVVDAAAAGLPRHLPRRHVLLLLVAAAVGRFAGGRHETLGERNGIEFLGFNYQLLTFIYWLY